MEKDRVHVPAPQKPCVSATFPASRFLDITFERWNLQSPVRDEDTRSQGSRGPDPFPHSLAGLCRDSLQTAAEELRESEGTPGGKWEVT